MTHPQDAPATKTVGRPLHQTTTKPRPTTKTEHAPLDPPTTEGSFHTAATELATAVGRQQIEPTHRTITATPRQLTSRSAA